MIYRLSADAVVIFHGLFILFAVFGGLLVLRWRKLIVLHVPAAVWGVVVEVFSLTCPLTSWEWHFRDLGGEAGYRESFVDHYITSLIYPQGLTDRVQLFIGLFVLAVNATIYGILISRVRRERAGRVREFEAVPSEAA